MADDSLLVPVIFGSVRAERQGIKAARFIVTALRENGCRPVLIDPMEKRLPLLDRMYKDFAPDEAPAVMRELAELYRSADGFCIVSAEYNHGVPPALKNMLDHFLEEYFWRPAGIVCYSGGQFGGVRAAMQLRAILAEMGMVTIPSLFPIPHVGEAFSEDGVPAHERTRQTANDFIAEFVWYMRALKAQRATGVPG